MTLDEARGCLGLTRGATVEQIQEAFRVRARQVHPDRHPHATESERHAMAVEFDRARRARDALVQWATHEAGSSTTPTAAPPQPEDAPGPAAAPPSDARHPEPEPEPRPRARPRTSETRTTAPPPPPERVTMRFDEFVAFTDAAGFSVGKRSGRYIDWARIIAWSTVGALAASVAVGVVLASQGMLIA